MTSARTEGDSARPLSESRPEGRSTASTHKPARLIASIHSAALPSGGRLRPVPKIASRISSEPSNRGWSAILTPTASRAAAIFTAAPWRAPRSRAATECRRPQLWRCRAAAIPSPPFDPFPQRTAVWPRQRRAICHPAASISHSTGSPNRAAATRSTSATWALVRVGTGLASGFIQVRVKFCLRGNDEIVAGIETAAAAV